MSLKVKKELKKLTHKSFKNVSNKNIKKNVNKFVNSLKKKCQHQQ